VEELQEMGNIKELPRYHKKAQHIEQKLTQAAERVLINLLLIKTISYELFL
jgi:hypothetical protein